MNYKEKFKIIKNEALLSQLMLIAPRPKVWRDSPFNSCAEMGF